MSNQPEIVKNLSERLKTKAMQMVTDREAYPDKDLAANYVYGLAFASAMIGKGTPPLEAGAILEKLADILYDELEQEALRAYE